MSLSQELDRLSQLHRDGELSNDEYSRAKARVLNGAAAGTTLVNGLNALTRSQQARWIAGVCGGIARATGLTPWLWRLMFVLMVPMGGSGVLIYLLLWIFVPQDTAAAPRAIEQGQVG